MKREGNLIITQENAEKYSALTSVGGYLSIYANAKLEALTSVGGCLYIYANAKLEALTSVGGCLYINANAKLEALTSVGGCLYINANAKLEALTSVGGCLYINANAKLEASKLIFKQGSKHTILRRKNGTIQAGCKKHRLDWWLKNGEKLGRNEGYTDVQIAEYKQLFEEIGK